MPVCLLLSSHRPTISTSVSISVPVLLFPPLATRSPDDGESSQPSRVSRKPPQPPGVTVTHPPLLFALPAAAFSLRACLSSLEIEHACLCLSPPHTTTTPATATATTSASGLGSGNVKSIEGQLEVLLLPSRRLDRHSSLLADFDRQLDGAVRYYVDKLLEEVGESQAEALRRADSEVLRRETSLREIKEEIERERRAQEGLLRELKQATVEAPVVKAAPVAAGAKAGGTHRR